MRLYLLRRAQSQEATYALQLERRHGTRLPNLFRQPIGGCIISWRCRAVIPLGVESFNDICNSPLQRVRRRQLALCEYAVTARNCGGQRDRSNAASGHQSFSPLHWSLPVLPIFFGSYDAGAENASSQRPQQEALADYVSLRSDSALARSPRHVRFGSPERTMAGSPRDVAEVPRAEVALRAMRIYRSAAPRR